MYLTIDFFTNYCIKYIGKTGKLQRFEEGIITYIIKVSTLGQISKGCNKKTGQPRYVYCRV